jgi:hypothetical protein
VQTLHKDPGSGVRSVLAYEVGRGLHGRAAEDLRSRREMRDPEPTLGDFIGKSLYRIYTYVNRPDPGQGFGVSTITEGREPPGSKWAATAPSRSRRSPIRT